MKFRHELVSYVNVDSLHLIYSSILGPLRVKYTNAIQLSPHTEQEGAVTERGQKHDQNETDDGEVQHAPI